MISENRLAGAFKFPNKPKDLKSTIYGIIATFVDLGYAVSIEPDGQVLKVDIYQTERFQNRQLPFEEDA